jgi:hypothetical protein
VRILGIDPGMRGGQDHGRAEAGLIAAVMNFPNFADYTARFEIPVAAGIALGEPGNTSTQVTEET